MSFDSPKFSSSSRNYHGSSDEDMEYERNNVERRRYWLMKLPAMYVPGHRQRYLFLNLDNIAGSLLMSNMLYQRVDGAASARDIFLNFAALTKHLSGNNPGVVKYQLVVYCKTSPSVAHALEKFGWKLKTFANDDKIMYNALMEQLDKGAINANGKTLVLATGDGFLGTTNANAYCEVVNKFLKQGWYVEIHAWLYALNNGYLRLQKENPGRVVVKPLDYVVNNLAQRNWRGYLPSVEHRETPSITREPSRFESRRVGPRPPAEPAMASSAACTEVWPRNETIPIRGKLPAGSTDRRSQPPPIPNRGQSVPSMIITPTSWADVVKKSRTNRSTTPATENSSPESTLFDLTEAPEAPPPSVGWPPAVPATPLFTSPFSALHAPPMRSDFDWNLQMHQLRDLLSMQQADLAMRQTVLQQTTDLMRLMREKEQRWQPGAPYRPGPRNHGLQEQADSNQ